MLNNDSMSQIKTDLLKAVKCINADRKKPVKAVLLKTDIPSNYNRWSNTLYVNRKEASMKEKLTDLVSEVDRKQKSMKDKPKLVSKKDHLFIQNLLKENPEYKAVYGLNSVVLTRGTNKITYYKNGRFYTGKVEIKDYSYSDLKAMADVGP